MRRQVDCTALGSRAFPNLRLSPIPVPCRVLPPPARPLVSVCVCPLLWIAIRGQQIIVKWEAIIFSTQKSQEKVRVEVLISGAQVQKPVRVGPMRLMSDA